MGGNTKQGQIALIRVAFKQYQNVSPLGNNHRIHIHPCQLNPRCGKPKCGFTGQIRIRPGRVQTGHRIRCIGPAKAVPKADVKSNATAIA